MSRFFPHTPYAEDQPLARTILYTHCLTRGLQAGVLVGAASTIPIYIYSRSRFSKTPPKLFVPSLLKFSGRGALIGTLALALAVPARMHNCSPIEWQDRSWRLLENKGQLECDDWTYAGMAATVPLIARGKIPGSLALGTVGVSSVLGMAGYMGWRYGVKRGVFEELVVEKEEIVV